MCGNNPATVKKIVNHPINTFLIKKKSKVQQPIISGIGDTVFLCFLLISNSPHTHNYSNTFSIGVDREIYHTKIC